MPRSQKPRKRYLPPRRAVRAPEVPLDPAQLRDLAIGYHGALDALRRGVGTWDDANALALAANVAIVLCDFGLGADWVHKVQQAQAALVTLDVRARRLGRYVLTGQELQDLQALLELHDAQLASDDCTQALMVDALADIKRRMAAGLVVEVQAA